MNRDRLSNDKVSEIRRERYAPRFLQWDYLHLRSLRDALASTFISLPVSQGPVLDLYCGTQPYQELIPWRPLWGVDIDLHYGRADVIANGVLPFRHGSFSRVICTQALYQVFDAELAVAEMYRVTAPDGYAIVSVPFIFRRELPWERKYTEADLRGLFRRWKSVTVFGAGGVGSGAAYYSGRLLYGLARRSKVVARALPALALPLNVVGSAVEQLAQPLAVRLPANLILVAQR